MADGAAMEEPFDIARARDGQTTLLLLGDVEEGSRRSPKDLDSPIMHLPIDMQMPARNDRDLVLDAHFKQPPTRLIRDGRSSKCGIVRVVFEWW